MHSFLLIHVYKEHLNVLDNQSCTMKVGQYSIACHIILITLSMLTWGKGLTELFSLLSILDDKGVQVARASDLELDVLSVLLDASG